MYRNKKEQASETILDVGPAPESDIKSFIRQVRMKCVEQGVLDLLAPNAVREHAFVEPEFGWALKFRSVVVEYATGEHSQEHEEQVEEEEGDIQRMMSQISTPLKEPAQKSTLTPPSRRTPRATFVSSSLAKSLSCRKAVTLDEEEGCTIAAVDAEGLVHSTNPVVTVDPIFYSNQVEACRRERKNRLDTWESFNKKVTKTVSVIMAKCTRKLQERLYLEFSARDPNRILQAIIGLVNTTDSKANLRKLDLEWLTLAILSGESIQDLCMRIDTLCIDLAAHAGRADKTDEDRIECVDRALRADARYSSDWMNTIKAQKKHSGSWESMKIELYQVQAVLADSKAQVARVRAAADAAKNNSGRGTVGNSDDKGKGKGRNGKEPEAKDEWSPELRALMATPAGKELAASLKAEQPKKAKKLPASDPAAPAKNTSKADWMKEQICHGCNQKGHFKKDCPEAKAPVSAMAMLGDQPASPTASNLEESDDSLKWVIPAEKTISAATFQPSMELMELAEENSTADFVSYDSVIACTGEIAEEDDVALLALVATLTVMPNPPDRGPNHDSSHMVTDSMHPESSHMASSLKKAIVDSGTTSHVVAEENNRLKNFVRRTESICLADLSKSVPSEGRGDLGPLRGALYAKDMAYTRWCRRPSSTLRARLRSSWMDVASCLTTHARTSS